MIIVTTKNQIFNMRLFILTLFFAFFSYSSFADDITKLISRAEQGIASAQYDLACYYLNNTGANHIEILRWLRKASKQNYDKAEHLIKFLIQDGHKSWGDYKLTPKYDFGILSETQEKDAKQQILKGCGDPKCKGHKGNFLILAHSYFHQEKYPLAIYYYKQALSQMREDNLGIMVKVGNENDEEYKEMNFPEASMDAYTMLGFCYEHGYGVPRNLQTAVDYYSLGGIYFSNNDIAKKYDASGVRRILSECNNPDLYEFCGDFIKPTEENIWGDGIYDCYVPLPSTDRAWRKQGVIFLKMGKFNIAKDLLFFSHDILNERIAELSCINVLWVAEMYSKGIGVPINQTIAYKLFYKIANEIGGPWNTLTDEYYSDIYADACYRLYECYTYGRGVSKDNSKAEYYFKEALKNGSTSAIYDDQNRYEISLR